MLFFIAFVGAAIIALVLWKAMSSARGDAPDAPGRQVAGPSRPGLSRPGLSRPRVSGPDDDPDFLRRLDERVRRRDDPPSA